MARAGFCGPSYQSSSLSANAQMLMNLYLEKDESGSGKSDFQMLYTPGLVSFAAIPGSMARGCFYEPSSNRGFVVVDALLYEVFSDGTYISRGAVSNDGKPASLCGSATQILIASGQHGYVFTLATNVLAADPAGLVMPLQVGFSDSYFIALRADNKFQISTLLDATSWPGLQVNAVSLWSDPLKAILVDHGELIVFAGEKSVVYYDSGSSSIFDVVPNGKLQVGIAAEFGRTRLDNSDFWWGSNEHGGAMAYRLQGYTPQRVSTHAIETAVQGYASVADAISWGIQWRGHNFWVTRFPSADKTWMFDVATGAWSELGYWSGSAFTSHRSNCHMFAFGKHLVGDCSSGTLYELSSTAYTDFGNTIRRVRRWPYIASEGRYLYVDGLEYECDMGLGPQPPLTTDGLTPAADGSNWRAPQIMTRWSDDGARTWSNEHWVGIGKAGEYDTRAVLRRLGRFWGTRGRVFETVFTDPVPIRFVDAYIDGPGFPPTERLSSQLRKQA